jgi:thiosulfate/3-mercaptopyruvate sulfurtransferase
MDGPLVSTEELAAGLGGPDFRIPDLSILDASWFLDGRDARAAFREAHIPGARFFDIEAIRDASSPLPHMLPSPADFAEAVGRLGVSDTDRIVVYDQAGLFSAARVWWSFRIMGAARVQVLDGGLPKWRAEGRPLETGEPAPRPASFRPTFNPALVRDYEAVAAALEAGSAQVADARSAIRFRGEAPEPRAGVRAGHMPGARNLPYDQLLNPDGTMKSPDALAAAFAEAGLRPGQPTIASCGSGVTAAILVLALARLGHWSAAVYDGSWADWGSRPDSEVVGGPE